jgi:transposase-like protein
LYWKFLRKKNISQIASEYGINPNKPGKWKKEAIGALAEVLEDGRRKG